MDKAENITKLSYKSLMSALWLLYAILIPLWLKEVKNKEVTRIMNEQYGAAK